MAIKWRRGDYIRLGKAVAEFNRELKKNETEMNKLFLPQPIDYKFLKNHIKTREGLNAYIGSLKQVRLGGAFDLEKLEGGEVITTFEKRILERGQAQGIEAVNKQIAKIEEQTKKDRGISVDKNLESILKTNRQKALEGRARDYKNLFNLSGQKFKKLAWELGINQTELQYHRAYIFRQNYVKVMKKHYSDYRDYWLLKKWINSHRDPVNFFNSLPEDAEFYPDDLHYQSDTVISEENFQSFLETLGIDVEAEYKKRADRMGITVDELKDRIDQEIKERQEKSK